MRHTVKVSARVLLALASPLPAPPPTRTTTIHNFDPSQKETHLPISFPRTAFLHHLQNASPRSPPTKDQTQHLPVRPRNPHQSTNRPHLPRRKDPPHTLPLLPIHRRSLANLRPRTLDLSQPTPRFPLLRFESRYPRPSGASTGF